MTLAQETDLLVADLPCGECPVAVKERFGSAVVTCLVLRRGGHYLRGDEERCLLSEINFMGSLIDLWRAWRAERGKGEK